MRASGMRERVEARNASELTLLTSEGEVDVGTVEAFRAWLLGAAGDGSAGVVVDLSEVTFIDSMGLAAVVELHGMLLGQGRPLALVAPRGTAPAQALTLTGLRGRLPVFETRSRAFEACGDLQAPGGAYVAAPEPSTARSAS